MKGLEAKTLGLKKVIRHEYKRIVAFMLTVAMVVTNFGTNLTVAFAAGEETSSLFLLDSSELEDAISTALESGDVFDFSSLELKAKQKSLKTSYEKLIGSKAGKVYQLDVDIDSSYATEHTDLQVFYNAGTDDVVFLFINESDMAVTFRANVSGYETARVTVNPNTTNIEDAEGVENAEDYSGTTMVDDEKKPQAEVVKPEGETSETVENGSDETEEETKADVTESENASESGETEETTGAENSSETDETTAAEETEAEAEETAEETEAAEPETEAPAAEEELQAEEGSATASISAKEVFRVSTSAEVAEETLADSTEEETEAETEDKAEVPEKETEAIPETTEAEETVAEDKTEETVADESKADETTAADETADGETVADETKDGELVNDETKAPAENPADNNGDSSEVDFDGDEQFLEDDSIELMGELAGKAYNTVTIWGRANARAYAVKAEDLVGEAAVEGQYNVDYSVDPVGAAAIKGAHTVNEGETLYFAVDPQVGYEITEVTANGEELEEVDAAGVASASNLEKYAHVYAVEEVSEDLEIVARLEETADVAHPEFNASYVGSDGVTIKLHAEEGIIPEGTELDATEVTEALGDTIKEKMESESEGAEFNKVLAYDINLLYNGEKLSNSWSKDGYVDVTFTGAPIQEMTEISDKVEIVAVDDTSKTQLTAEKAEAVEASELKLESVSEQSVEGEAVEEVGFKAEHFTIYAVTASSGVMAASIEKYNTTMKIGQTQTLESDKSGYYVSWSSSNESALTVTGRGQTATVTAVGVGTATITHVYHNYWGGNPREDTATITVTADPITGVTLTGEDTVKAFDSIKLTAKTEPVGSAASSLEWESSNTAILTVDNTGNVTGVAPGTAIVTVHATSFVDAKVYTETKEITVIPATQSTDKALFYYLKTPTSDPKSNARDQWGECIGTGTITVTGGTWVDSGKNMYSPTHRVLTWPDGSTGSTWTIDKNKYGSHWDAIFNAYKRSVESKYNGVTLTKDDIQSITLIPYKISRNNSSNPDKHVDCQVRIVVKDFYNAIYYVEDAGETGFQSVQQSGPYRSGDTTAPTATTVAAYPDTKVKNGVTYTFVGWYDNEQFTGNVISFPYAMRANKEFYAKYVAGYNVNYDLDGGSWNIPSTYFKNADSNVYVVGTTPTKTGYDFNGWDRQDDDSHVYVANEKFMMPDNNVTFKAKWTPKEVSYTVNYYWAGTTTSVAESKTVTGKHFGDVINDEVPVEAEGYTAINTPQSLTLGSEANIINFYYYKNVILTANSDEKTYNGNEQNVHGYTCSVSGVVFSRITAVANGTDAAEYASTFTENAVGKIDDSRRYIVESTHTGLLKIKPRPVTVKAASDEKEYDGTVLTNAGWSVEKATETTGLVGTDTIGSVKVTGSQLYPGRSSNVPSEASFTSGKATNYQISYVNGTLEVKDRSTKYVITANAPDGEYTYDGTAKTASGVTYDTLTFGGETYTVEGLSSSRTETDADPAGYETTIVGTAVVKDSAGNDVTNQFRVDTTDTGLLKIKPREVTVTAASDEKEYDGTVLTNAGWSVEAATETTGLVGTDTIGDVKVTGSQLYPGSSSNVPSEASFTSGKATNYQISYVNGTLKVKDRGTKYVITANAPDREYTYDGTAKTASGVTYDKLTFGGKTYTVEGLSCSRTETDVDPTGNGYVTTIVGTAVVKDSDGQDVTEQFTVNATDTGLLKINPRKVTITAASDKKQYDGTVLVSGNWSVEKATENTGLVGGDVIGTVKVTGSQLQPGKSSNVPSDAKFTVGKASNYDIEYVNGSLEITGNSNNNNGGEGGGSSSGGGGSSSGPRDNGSTPSGGPGATTVTIDPDAVPLANLPNEDGAADLLVIDDEDVPLAALPKTGQSGASGLVLFLSSMMLAAFVAVSKKREDDK